MLSVVDIYYSFPDVLAERTDEVTFPKGRHTSGIRVSIETDPCESHTGNVNDSKIKSHRGVIRGIIMTHYCSIIIIILSKSIFFFFVKLRVSELANICVYRQLSIICKFLYFDENNENVVL